MPNIKKAEYDNLKMDIKMLQLLLSSERQTVDNLRIDFLVIQRAAEKWERYYLAVREALKVEEEVEIPNCFNLVDSVEYIVNRQEQIEEQRKINEKLDNHAREMSGRVLRGFYS